jgi:hypothetical protein
MQVLLDYKIVRFVTGWRRLAFRKLCGIGEALPMAASTAAALAGAAL